MAAIDDLTAQVKATNDAIQSAITLLNSRPATTDPAVINATTALKASTDQLTTAITNNTGTV